MPKENRNIPSLTVTGIGSRWFNYTLKIPRENGMSEVRGAGKINEPIMLDFEDEK